MNYKASLILLLSLVPFWAQAEDSTGTWVKKAAFPSSSRNFGLGFCIAGKGYYGLGQKQTKPFVYKTYNDLWEYDPAKNTWTQKADFPGPGRLMAKGFTLDSNIYVGFGYVIAAYGPNAGSNDHQTDLYKFDVRSNSWTQMRNSLLGRGEIFFVMNNILFSVNPEFKSLNRYTSKTDTWFENAWEKDEVSPPYESFVGESASFSLWDHQYYVTTLRKKGSYVNQLWEFDPRNIIWKQKNDLPGNGSDSLYVITPGKKIIVLRNGNECLEYEPITDTWSAAKQTSSAHRGFQPAFSAGGKCYGFDKYEFWEFTP